MRLCVLLLCFALPCYAGAQINLLGKDNGIAAKTEEALSRKNYEKAFLLQQSVLQHSSSATELIQAGNYFYGTDSFALSLQAFLKALQLCPKCGTQLYFPISRAAWKTGQYTLCEQYLNRLGQINKNWQPEMADAVALMQRNLRFIAGAPPFDTVAHVTNVYGNINTPFNETFPTLSPDDSMLVFTRQTNGEDDDFYYSERDSCHQWQQAQDMGTPPNSPGNESAHLITADGHYLFYMTGGNRSSNGWAQGGNDIFMAYRACKKCPWSPSIPLGATINTPDYEGMPSLSADNKYLYFVSDRPGGFGGKDIWVTQFENGFWQIPENLGSTVNTPYDDISPHIAPDGKTLYFASNGHGGYGGYDLYKAIKGSGEGQNWDTCQNLGQPVNTPFNEISPFIDPYGQQIYFASDRPDGYGGYDLYTATLAPQKRPAPYSYITGYVTDDEMKSHYRYVQIRCFDLNTNQMIGHYQSNGGDGSYVMPLPLNTPVEIQADYGGFQDYRDTVTLTETHLFPFDTFNIILSPVTARHEDTWQPDTAPAPELIYEIHYQRNMLDIPEADKIALRDKIDTYQHVNHVKFFINSYTDNSGAPYINEQYSDERAARVAQFIEGTGISKEQIQAQGWGDSQPVVPNDTEENRYQNRRVTISIAY